MEERIKHVEIAGKAYPLNFSVSAANEVTRRYGGITGINDALGLGSTQEDQTPEQKERAGARIRDEIAWLLALLIQQGIAYEKLMGGAPEKPLTEDEICILASPSDILGMRLSVLEAVGAGLGVTVETEPDVKNAGTTQGN